jgi:DNA-directed RNA polymerase subunit RPC12/RpoP
MALFRCSECQKEISDKADRCPSCGAPVTKSRPKSGMGVGGRLITVIFGLLFLWWLFGNNTPQQSVSNQSNDAPTSQPLVADKIPSTPEELVSKLLDTPEAEPHATQVGKTLLVSYNLKPWSLTNWSIRTAFNSNVFKIVPKEFETFPEIQEIEITGNVTLYRCEGQ